MSEKGYFLHTAKEGHLRLLPLAPAVHLPNPLMPKNLLLRSKLNKRHKAAKMLYNKLPLMIPIADLPQKLPYFRLMDFMAFELDVDLPGSLGTGCLVFYVLQLQGWVFGDWGGGGGFVEF